MWEHLEEDFSFVSLHSRYRSIENLIKEDCNFGRRLGKWWGDGQPVGAESLVDLYSNEGEADMRHRCIGFARPLYKQRDLCIIHCPHALWTWPKGRISPNLCYFIKTWVQFYHCLPACHVLTGYNTTSIFYRKGKTTVDLEEMSNIGWSNSLDEARKYAF